MSIRKSLILSLLLHNFIVFGRLENNFTEIRNDIFHLALKFSIFNELYFPFLEENKCILEAFHHNKLMQMYYIQNHQLLKDQVEDTIKKKKEYIKLLKNIKALEVEYEEHLRKLSQENNDDFNFEAKSKCEKALKEHDSRLSVQKPLLDKSLEQTRISFKRALSLFQPKYLPCKTNEEDDLQFRRKIRQFHTSILMLISLKYQLQYIYYSIFDVMQKKDLDVHSSLSSLSNLLVAQAILQNIIEVMSSSNEIKTRVHYLNNQLIMSMNNLPQENEQEERLDGSKAIVPSSRELSL